LGGQKLGFVSGFVQSGFLQNSLLVKLFQSGEVPLRLVNTQVHFFDLGPLDHKLRLSQLDLVPGRFNLFRAIRLHGRITNRFRAISLDGREADLL
jgi:hypothetical protein